MKSEAESIPITGPEDSLEATLALLHGARRSVHLYTPYMAPQIFNAVSFIDALRACIAEQPRIRFYMLLPPAADWRLNCRHFWHLAERLSSALILRTLPTNEPRERPEFSQAFMIADETQLLHFVDPYRQSGHFSDTLSSDVRKLLNFHTEIWEKSIPDPDLRRLQI